MLPLLLALLIPPPMDWTPPQASGPGTFCGHTFRLELLEGERIRQDWPGEMVINDVFGTYRVTSPAGEVVVTENGARTRPTGTSTAVAGSDFRAFGGGTYALPVSSTGSIEAVTVRVPAAMPGPEAQALLRRVNPGVPAGTKCLAPENREAAGERG